MVRSQALSNVTISRLARAGGVGIETVRYYQRRGLLSPPPRGGDGRGVRRYGDADLRRLRFIRLAQEAGFTLKQIRELLDLDAAKDQARIRALAQSRIAALDEEISQKKDARDALARLAKQCASSKGRCPIIEAFDRG